MGTLFPYHTFFPNLLTSGFKLWLDQCNDLSVLFQVIADWEKYLRQRNKRNINGRKINRFSQIFRLYITDVGLFHADHSFILT